MTLQGMLADFSVGDVLQLIGQQQKTGILTLTRHDGAEHAAVHFAKGQVVGVESRTRPVHDRIGMLLLRAHAITETQLKTALDVHKKTMRRVGDVLLHQGVIDQETLRTFVQLQKCETLYQLFTWHDGHFSFQATQVVHMPTDAMRSESVLLEGFRQLDEWPLIRAKIADHATTYTVIKSLESVPAKRLTPQVRHVFGLVHPERNVDTLIGISRLGSFETCKALWVLLDSGVITAVGGHHAEATARQSRRSSRSAMRAVAQWIAVSVFISSVMWLLLQRIQSFCDVTGKTGDAALVELLRRL